MKSIIEMVSQPVVFEVFPFIKIREYDGWHYWIENCEGEGLPIRKQVLATMLLKWIEKNI